MCLIFRVLIKLREAARQLVQTMITTKRNPNKIKRQADVSELTMSEVFAQYRQHLDPGPNSVQC
ncbi:cytoplasmic protein [Salmonella enterica subsp. arizonae]|nr:cytoplasmic protein [Salmonella enterica subsp. arizonae]